MEISVNEGRTGLEEWSNDSKEAVKKEKTRSNRRRKRGGEANEIDAFIPVTVSTSRYNFIETKLSPVDIQFPGGGTGFPTFRRWNNSALRLDRTDDGRRREIERKRERERKRGKRNRFRRIETRENSCSQASENVTVSPDADAGFPCRLLHASRETKLDDIVNAPRYEYIYI